MREQLERFGHWAICAILVWTAWPGFTGPEAPPKVDRPRPPVVAKANLEQRDQNETLVAFRDAFQADWAPYGPEWSPESIAEKRRIHEEAQAAAIHAANEAQLAKKAKELQNAAVKHALNEPASFTLTLESVLCADGIATARICGRSVVVGDPVPGLGLTPAPVLVRAQGEEAEVSWRGMAWTVRIDRPVVVTVSQDAPEAPAAAARQETPK